MKKVYKGLLAFTLISIVAQTLMANTSEEQTAVVSVSPYYSFESIKRFDGDGVITLYIESPQVRLQYIDIDPVTVSQFCRGISSESLPPLYNVERETLNSENYSLMRYNKQIGIWQDIIVGQYPEWKLRATSVTCHFSNKKSKIRR